MPSLIAINAFAAVARRLSFRRAAEDLALTQSAVSRHVQGLERDLGVLLLVRHGRSLSLTEEGLALFREVDAGLDRIHKAIEVVQHRQPSLRVSLLPSFAMHWLVPRLPAFAAEYPRIEIKLNPDYQLVDLAANDADIALRYGHGAWPGLHAVRLIEEELVPVAAPALAAKIKKPRFDPTGRTLLDASDNFEWEALARHLGFDLASAGRQTRLMDYNIVMQAACDGHGIAIGRRSQIARYLEAGQLVPLIDRWITCGIGHYFVTLPARRDEPAIRAFRRWLQAQVRTDIR
jgi:LysR family glycine cleavage system transcriptional activator